MNNWQIHWDHSRQWHCLRGRRSPVKPVMSFSEARNINSPILLRILPGPQGDFIWLSLNKSILITYEWQRLTGQKYRMWVHVPSIKLKMNIQLYYNIYKDDRCASVTIIFVFYFWNCEWSSTSVCRFVQLENFFCLEGLLNVTSSPYTIELKFLKGYACMVVEVHKGTVAYW